MADMSKAMTAESFTVSKVGDKGDRRITSTRAFNFESIRVLTFYYFKYKTTVDVEKLAHRGFFYDRFSDDVRCFYCPLKLSYMNKFEEPSSHGRKDKCKMAKFPLNGNVPIILKDPDPEDSYALLNRLLQRSLTYNISDSIANEKTEIDFNEKLAFNQLEFLFADGVDSQDFSNYEVRLSTFDPWFPYLSAVDKPKKERFAKAGFVYTGISDVVMCFKCKGGLFNTGRSDDPIDDHVRYYGYCQFVKENFPGNAHFSIKGLVMMMLSSEEALLMSHPMIRNLIHHGFEYSDVFKWIVEYVRIYSCFPTDLKMCRKELKEALKKKSTKK